MLHISMTERDAANLRDMLDARLTELRREISHTDSPRFRETLYELEGAVERLLNQLRGAGTAAPGGATERPV